MSWRERVAPFGAVDADVQHAVVDVRDEIPAPETGASITGSFAHASRYTAAALSCSTLPATSSGSPDSSASA